MDPLGRRKKKGDKEELKTIQWNGVEIESLLMAKQWNNEKGWQRRQFKQKRGSQDDFDCLVILRDYNGIKLDN